MIKGVKGAKGENLRKELGGSFAYLTRCAESDEYVEWDNLADINTILSRNPQLRKAIEEKLLREIWEMA